MAINPITGIPDGSISSIYYGHDGTIHYGHNGTFTQANHETIQGKMLIHTHRISGVALDNYVMYPGDVKKMMASGLVEELLNSGCIEFTKTHEQHTGDWVFRARVFVVPDDKVRILRQNGY